MGSRTREFVNESYAAVKACLQAYARVARAGSVLARECYDGRTLTCPADSRLKEYDEAVDALEEATARALEVVDGLKPFVDALDGPLAELGGVCAASVAEAVARLGVATVGEALPSKKLTFGEKKTREWLRDLGRAHLAGDGGSDVPIFSAGQVEAALDREAGRLLLLMRREKFQVESFRLGLWYVDGGDVVFEGKLRSLRGNPARLLELLVLADGRPVSHEEIASRVHGSEEASDDAVRSNKAKLVKLLKACERPEVAKAIDGRGGAYWLDFGVLEQESREAHTGSRRLTRRSD